MNKNSLRIKINTKKTDTNANKAVRQEITFMKFLEKASTIISSKSYNAHNKLQHKLKDTPITFVVPQELKRELLHRVDEGNERSAKSVTKYSNQSKEKTNNQLSEQDEQKLRFLMIRKNQLMEKLRKIDYHLMNPRVQSNRQAHLLTNQSKVTQRSRFNYQREKNDLSSLKIRQQQVYDVNKHQKTMQMLTRLNNEKMKRQEKIISTMKIKQLTEIKKIEDIQRNRSQLSLSRNTKHPNIKMNSKDRQSEHSSKIKLPQFDGISQIQGENLNEFELLEHLPVSHRQKQTINSSQNIENNIGPQ